jgi:methyl-accepting chemotaxis protein
MAKADLTLPTGTMVTIDGTPEEISQLLDHYAGSTPLKPTGRMTAPGLLLAEPLAASRNGRLVLFSLLVAGLFIVTTMVGYLNLKSISGDLAAMYFDVTVPYSNLAQAQAQLERVLKDVTEFVYVSDTRSTSQAALDEDLSNLDDQMARYRTVYLTAEEAAMLKRFDEAWSAYRSGLDRVMAQVQSDDQAAVAVSLAESQPVAQAVRDVLAQGAELKLRQADELHQHGLARMWSASMVLLAVGVMDILIVGLLGVFLARQGK